MELGQAHGLLDQAMSVELSGADLAALTATIAAARRLQAVLEARVMTATTEIAQHSSFPEKNVADAAMVSLAEAQRIMARGETVTDIPALADACEQGHVTGRHVDEFASVLKRVSPPVAEQLRADAARLVDQAASMPAGRFGHVLRREAAHLEAAGDDDARLVRQKRAVRLSSFVETSGMGRWSAYWDPETYRDLEKLLDARVEALFLDRTPEHCPADPLDRQQFLRAHALVDLITNGASATRPQIVVVRRGDDGELEIDWGRRGVELPDEKLAELARVGAVFGVTVNDGDIVSARGRLNLGRTTRLANRDQRRALAAVHATCAIPGCEVDYWRTKLHHVIWWRNGGTTDLGNLLPVCAHHHTLIHAQNWQIKLAPGRTVTITLADGTTLTDRAP